MVVNKLYSNYTYSVEASVNAGVDMIMVPYNYSEFIDTLTDLVNKKAVPLSRIDDAVTRILRVKFAMGLFEHPMADTGLANELGSKAHRELAREAVRKSLVVLKNGKDEKKPVIPLPKKANKILVAGTHADNLAYQCGAYVNGQRQGKILERPFKTGESINGRHVINGNSPSSVPFLDVEKELELASRSALDFEAKKVSQNMKELGLERARKHSWQDTYVFTKAMGEMVLSSVRGNVPVVILRPSVIESTYRDPFPGWIEGNRMMDPVVTYYGKGLLSGFPVDPNGVIDVVPVDMVARIHWQQLLYWYTLEVIVKPSH